MDKLMYLFEYFCTPFWLYEKGDFVKVENIDIFSLPISSYLSQEIYKLDKMYQTPFNNDYPPEPLHSDLLHEIIFANRVVLSYHLLKKEVEGKYELIFNVKYWENRVMYLKKELNIEY